MIDVCVVTYQRPHRIKTIVNQLMSQTYKDFTINIWNNSPHRIEIPDVNIFNAGVNGGSSDRFKLAHKTNGDIIVFLDDDEEIVPEFLGYNLQQYNKFGGICGWFSKRWETEDYWKPVQFLPEGEEADYIGTGGMILGREVLSDPRLLDIPEEYRRVEDLYLSYIARENGYKMFSVKKMCNILEDGNDQGYALVQYKRDAFTSLRRAGWKLLKDNA